MYSGSIDLTLVRVPRGRSVSRKLHGIQHLTQTARAIYTASEAVLSILYGAIDSELEISSSALASPLHLHDTVQDTLASLGESLLLERPAFRVFQAGPRHSTS